MDVYKKMYLRLFNQVTDAIELLKQNRRVEAVNTLIDAQLECEDLFIEAED